MKAQKCSCCGAPLQNNGYGAHCNYCGVNYQMEKSDYTQQIPFSGYSSYTNVTGKIQFTGSGIFVPEILL